MFKKIMSIEDMGKCLNAVHAYVCDVLYGNGAKLC